MTACGTDKSDKSVLHRSVFARLFARARGGVRPHWGITVIPAPRAAPAPVMSPGGDGVDPVKTPSQVMSPGGDGVEHARGAWQCNGTCQNRRNPRECRWFHSGCSGGQKLGDKASPMCAGCLKEAGKRADAPPAKRVRRGRDV